MTDQGTNKTGFVRDDQLKKELQDELRAKRAVRSEDVFGPQGENRSAAEAEAMPSPGTPPGMTPDDVDARSDLARHLEPSIFPARRAALLGALHRHQAPDALLERVGSLPGGQEYPNVQAVARALGLGTEKPRS